ncbi:MAG: hypothetical protein B6U97_04145, partial [Candidatus Altiarchaeales archaeon ex4484_96]
VDYVTVNEKAIYRIKITDKHPLIRCDIQGTYGSDEEDPADRCNIYYTYDITVSGLPYPMEYEDGITVYQGSSKTTELIITPDYAGRYVYSFEVSEKNDKTIIDSDSATLIVNGYTNCDEACRNQGYDYGVCRSSCGVDERNIGTRYCLQYAQPEPLMDSVVASTASGGGLGVTSTSEEQKSYTRYCCCGFRELEVMAWTNKNKYETGESVKVYAKVSYTDESNIDAKVYGIMEKPDGTTDDVEFRQVCAIAEITDAIEKVYASDASISTEIGCSNAEGYCNPRCIYVASYEDTQLSGRYELTVYAVTPEGREAKAKLYFSVNEPQLSCDEICGLEGYDYGICRASCEPDEKNMGSGYCEKEYALASDATYALKVCCCGKLTPPTPPAEKIKIQLKRGWNLITLPGEGTLEKGSCERMYGFVYMNSRYYTMEELEAEIGADELMEYLRLHSFWIYAFENCYLEFELEEYSSFTEINPVSGWNFIPVTYDMESMTLESVKGDCTLDKTYMWNPDKQTWEKIGLDYVFGVNDPYQGFISYTKKDCCFGTDQLTPPPLPED